MRPWRSIEKAARSKLFSFRVGLLTASRRLLRAAGIYRLAGPTRDHYVARALSPSPPWHGGFRH